MIIDNIEDIEGFLKNNLKDIKGLILAPDGQDKEGHDVYRLTAMNIDHDTEDSSMVVKLDGDSISKVICKYLKSMTNLAILGLVHANMKQVMKLPASIEYISIKNFVGSDVSGFKKMLEKMPKLAILSIEDWLDYEHSDRFLERLNLNGSLVSKSEDMSTYISKFAHDSKSMIVNIESNNIVILHYSQPGVMPQEVKYIRFVLTYTDAYKDVKNKILKNFHNMPNLESLVIMKSNDISVRIRQSYKQQYP